MASKSHVCGPCKDNNKVAVVYCNVCETTLCEECQVEHGLVKILKSHRLRDVKELPPIEISDLLKSLSVCPNHDKEEVEYLCKIHDVACCSKCVIVDHRNCKEVRVLADIGSNSNAEGAGLKHILEELTKKGQELEEHENKHNILINETEMQAKALLKIVKERLLEAYENLEKEVFSSIAEKKEKITSQIDKQTACVQKFQTEVKRQTCLVNQIEEFGSKVQITLMERKLQQEIAVRLQGVVKELELNRSKTGFSCIMSGSFEKNLVELRNALHIDDTMNGDNEMSSDEYTDSNRLENFKETIRTTLRNNHLLPSVFIKDKEFIAIHKQFFAFMKEDSGGIVFYDEETSYITDGMQCEVKSWSPTEIEMYMPDLNRCDYTETSTQINLRFVEKDL